MAIKKEKFFEIIHNVSESKDLNEDNLLERIGSELKGTNQDSYSTHDNLKINKMFNVSDSSKLVNYTLLHLAAECNNAKVVEYLLKNKAEVNELIYELDGAKSKLTALHIAALHGHQEIVQLLLNNNADPSLKDSQDRTPRDIVSDVKGKEAIIKMLKEGEQRCVEARATRRQTCRQSTLQPNNKTPGNLAVNGNNTTAAVQAWNARDQKKNNGTTLNSREIYAQDENGLTCLHHAVVKNNEESVKILIEYGANVNAQDKDGVTPLHFAVEKNNEKLVKFLIKHGADVDARNRDEHTPLHYAAMHGYVEIVKYLIDNGANVNAQDEDGHIPLHFAVKYENKELANLLIKHGADRSLIKDEGLIIDRLNSMCGQLPKVVPSTFSHSKTHNATETPEKAEKVEKHKAKLKELRTQLKDEQKKNESLTQKIRELGNENATLNSELEKTKTKKNEVPLEKAQKELAELRNYVTEHETKLEALEKLNEENLSLKQQIQDLKSKNTTFEGGLEKAQKELEESKSCIARYETKLEALNKLDEENKLLTQKIKSLENENTPLEGELGKTKTNEVSLEKVGKRQFSPKVAYASLAAMLAVGAALSIASGLSALLIVAASVVSALIAGGITYTISKPIAPDTELKEVDIQGSAQPPMSSQCPDTGI